MFKIISSTILFFQSGMSYLFSGAEVALNACDSSQLDKEAIAFLNGGKRSLATCALANHTANAGLSLLNGYIVGSFCGIGWGIFTSVFSLFGLWYLGELSPKLIAQEEPNKFLNDHAKKLNRTKAALAPLVNRLVKDEPITKVQLNERELVSAAKMADEEWSLLLLPLYKESQTIGGIASHRSYSVEEVTSINSIESIMTRHAQSDEDDWVEYQLVCARTLKKLGFFNTVTIIRWMMNHK
jgi:hypothetical protein